MTKSTETFELWSQRINDNIIHYLNFILKNNSKYNSKAFGKGKQQQGSSKSSEASESKKLKTINLENNLISEEVIKTISDILKFDSTLTKLNLQNNSIEVEGAKEIADGLKLNTSLIELDLARNKLSTDEQRKSPMFKNKHKFKKYLT